MVGSRPVDMLMDPAVRFDLNLGEALENSGRYHKFIEKLIHLKVTRPDIIFVPGLLS